MYMNSMVTRYQVPRGRQKGMTLIEVMVAMIISLVVSMSMVMLMANTLGTGTRTIAMTRLTQELRTAMQIISRDLRRANFISPVDAVSCYANVNCLDDLGFAANIGLIEIGDDDDCLSFWLDRDLSSGFEATEMGAFRLAVNDDIGSIEMLTRFTGMGADNCPDDAGDNWVAITDPDIVDVQSFVVDDTDIYTEVLSSTGSFQTVQKIGLLINADLINNGGTGFTISREIGDEIRIRNNFTTL